MKEQNARALLGFSIGQETARGEILYKDIELASKLYGSITLLAGDTLQRFTKMITDKCDLQAGYALALQEGNAFIEEVGNICSALDLQCHIIRWDELISRPEFVQKKQQIEHLYTENTNGYKKAVRDTVGKFIRRYQDKGLIPAKDAKAAFDICLEYVKEECAVFLMLEGQYTHLQYHYPLGAAIEHIASLANIETVEAAKLHKHLAKPAAPMMHATFFKLASSPPDSPESIMVDTFLTMIKSQVDTFFRTPLPPVAKQAALTQLDQYLHSKRLEKDFTRCSI